VPLEQWLIILRVHSSEIENWVGLWAGGNSRNSRVTGDDDKVRWRKLYRQCGASRICAVNKKYSTLRAASNPKKAGRPSKSEVLVQENQGKWENQGAGGGGKGRVNCLITAASCRGKQRRRCQEQRENPRRTAPFVAASSPKRVLIHTIREGLHIHFEFPPRKTLPLEWRNQNSLIQVAGGV